MTKRQRQRRLERRQHFNAVHANDGGGDGFGGAVKGRGPVRAGAPVGRFGRPWRRIDGYVAHGEFLEREIARADTPAQTEAAQRALLAQIHKVERFYRRLKGEKE